MRLRHLLVIPCVALLAGCKVERLRRTDSSSAAATADTSAGAAAPTPAGPTADADTLTGLAADSSGDAASSGALAAPRTPPSPDDTMPVTATAAELRELAAALVIPVEGVQAADLHDSFDERRGGGSRPHEALDILASRGTPVRSATDGRLLKRHSSAAGGLMVYAADASDRFILMYGHLDRYADDLPDGPAPLRRGQVIGFVGTSGNASAGTPHLHFAIARGHPSTTWWRGTPVNPYPLLTGRAPVP